ncbi:hypothetical protein TEA_005859 [Camellia sinensis var. sinensis]|uniref:K-box domain-containing protein n=1 Tax=Camellia sinensis var. sinensis TaxID=542762 RepID=A0A4S4EKB7_CAMSN|nr:hypothetical protein TEA_005859 [Camellia sinensis var. sinensis]
MPYPSRTQQRQTYPTTLPMPYPIEADVLDHFLPYPVRVQPYRMERILERYERYSYAERQLVAADIDSQGRWTLEHVKLKARLEVLERNQRHFMGEDLDTLSVKELQSLEHQLDSALKHLRSRKVDYERILNSFEDKALLEENKLLAKKIKEKEEKELARHAQLEQQNHDQNSSSVDLSQPLHSLDIGGAYQAAAGSNGDVEGAPFQTQNGSVMPPWMICHING